MSSINNQSTGLKPGYPENLNHIYPPVYPHNLNHIYPKVTAGVSTSTNAVDTVEKAASRPASVNSQSSQSSDQTQGAKSNVFTNVVAFVAGVFSFLASKASALFHKLTGNRFANATTTQPVLDDASEKTPALSLRSPAASVKSLALSETSVPPSPRAISVAFSEKSVAPSVTSVASALSQPVKSTQVLSASAWDEAVRPLAQKAFEEGGNSDELANWTSAENVLRSQGLEREV